MDAFSKINPNIQLVWDATSIKNIQFCPRHYQYSNLQGWATESADLEYGKFIANALEHYQKARLDGLSKEDALLPILRETLEATYTDEDTQWGGRYETMWKCKGETKFKNDKGNRAKCPNAFERVWYPDDPPDVCFMCGSGIRTERHYIPEHKTKNRHTLIRALIWYVLDQPEDLLDGLRPYVFPDGTKAVELSGKIPLPYTSSTGEDLILAWNIDYIGQFGDELWITDNKTTSKPLNEKFFASYGIDTQFDTYDLIGSIAYPDLGIRGTMVDAIQVSANGVEFGRKTYPKTEEYREEHFEDLAYWLEQADNYATSGYWPMNKRNCWLCPFNTVCSQSPKMRQGYLKSNFKTREKWNPARER